MTEPIPLYDSIHGDPVPESAYIVRVTEVSEFTDCRRKWFIHSQNGLNLEVPKPSFSLAFGLLMHKAWEAERLGNDPAQAFKDALQEKSQELGDDLMFDPDIQAEFDELNQLGLGLLEYQAGWRKENPHEAKVVAVEHRMLLPVYVLGSDPPALAAVTSHDGHVVAPLYLAAKIDGLERTPNGQYWVNEDKTITKSANLDNLPHLNLDVQASLNLWVARQVWPEYDIIGSSYFIARKQLWSSRVKNPIMARPRVIRNQAQQNFYLQHLYNVATDMFRVSIGEAAPYPALPSTTGSPCEWKCDATAVCEGLNRGEDVQHLLNAMFVPRKPFRETLRDELSESQCYYKEDE